jgi:hypothetical protein
VAKGDRVVNDKVTICLGCEKVTDRKERLPAVRSARHMLRRARGFALFFYGATVLPVQMVSDVALAGIGGDTERLYVRRR